MKARATRQKPIVGAEHYATDVVPDPSSQTCELTRLLLTAEEAAFALAISPRTLWTLTNAGQIPCVRLGRCVRYAPDALQDWIRGQPQ